MDVIGHEHPEDELRITWVERGCELLCEISLIAMIVLISAETIARTVLGVSFEVSDEVGAYLLVAITFLSLSVCVARNEFHYVELVQARITPKARAMSRVFFDVIALVCSAVILWQVIRLEWISWNSGDMAATWLATPVWMPRLSLPIGMAALCFTLTRSLIKHWRRLSAIRRDTAS